MRPIVKAFPVQIPPGFKPSDFDHDGDDIGSSGKTCPGYDAKDNYRPRWGSPFLAMRSKGIHRALDIMAAEGALICSPVDGEIQSEGESPKGGYHVFVEDDQGFVWYFAHMRSKCLFEKGMRVKAGEVLGYVGRSGNAHYATPKGLRGCPHLHLSVTVPTGYKKQKDIDQNGTKIDPLPLIRGLYEGWKRKADPK